MEPFLLIVADIFDIRGRGIVVVGKIQSGTISVGDTLTLSHGSHQRRVSVLSIEKFQRRDLHDATEGPEDVGIGLGGVSSRKDVAVGSVLSV